MFSKNIVAAAAALAVGANACAGHSNATGGLNDISLQVGKVYFGTAADIPGTGETSDPYYLAQFNNASDFGQATPANVMKWGPSSSKAYQYNFTDGDEFVRLAKASNKLIRCHNLVWHNELPDWISNGNWTNATLLEAVEDRVIQAVSHFGDDCYAWDVVNEALNDDGTFRESIFYNVTGFSYIEVAFRTAQDVVNELGLKTKLYYNDYNIENPGAKSTSAQQNIVAPLKAAGIRIDGVGLQSHFVVGGTPSTEQQVANMEAFTALGVDVAITELDIRLTLPVTDALKVQQQDDYNTTLAACALVKGCVGTTLWDFDDDYSWIPGTFAGQGYGCPWYGVNGTDSPLVRKIAYDGIVSGLQYA